MVADIDIRWRNRRWSYTGIAIDVSTEVDIVTRQYAPREIEFTVPMGETLTDWIQGSAWEAIRVQVTVGGKVYSTSPVTSVKATSTTNGASGMTTITVADKPAESSPCPPMSDITIRTKDEEATAAANAAALAAWTINDAREGSDWINGSMDYSVRDMSTTSPPDPTNVFALKVQGLTFPIPFGKPGKDSKPAYRVIQIDDSHRRLLVAAFPIKGTVSIQKSGYSTWYSYTIEPYRVNGRDVSVVAIPTFPGIPADQAYDTGAAFYVAFDGTARGLPGDAVSVCQWLLSKTIGVRVDYAGWSGVASRLRDYTFDTCLDQTGDAWQILTGDVLPLLPIQIVPTPYGIGAKWLDLDPRKARIRKRMVLGTTIDPTAATVVSFDAEQATTVANIGFAPNAASGDYAGRVLTSAATMGLALESASQAAGKTRKIDTPWIQDRAVAQIVARDIVTAGCIRYARFEVDAAPMMHGDEGTDPVHAGDVFDVYDSGSVTVSGMVLGEKRSGNDLKFVIGIMQG